MIRVVLADDHPVVREGLRGMLNAEPDISVVGEAGSGAEAVTLAESLRPGVILMDLRMPDVDGVTATERILARAPATRIIVVTTYESDTDILRAVEAGAAGYLLKDASRAALAEAVRDAAKGRTVLSPTVADRLVTWCASRRRRRCRHANSRCSNGSRVAARTPRSAARCTSARPP